MVPSHPGAVKKDGQLMYGIPQVCAYDAAPSKPTLVGRGLADFFFLHMPLMHICRDVTTTVDSCGEVRMHGQWCCWGHV